MPHHKGHVLLSLGHSEAFREQVQLRKGKEVVSENVIKKKSTFCSITCFIGIRMGLVGIE